MVSFGEVILLLLIIASSFLAVYFHSLLASIIALSAMSLVLALEFYILQAPDVAIAEAGIGAALVTAIFIMAMSSMRKERGK
ncbi:MAG: DUF4040 domain-containing protein [Synergistetes bacterium]|nr:DUF4040 domain-containing protein [Synergistota bacterium]